MRLLSPRGRWVLLAVAVATLVVGLRQFLGDQRGGAPADRVASPLTDGRAALATGGAAEDRRVSALADGSEVERGPAPDASEPPSDDAGSQEEPPLRLGMPVVPAFPGDSYWVQYYERYGDMTADEYFAVFDTEATVLHDMMFDCAKEQVSYGAFYRYEPGEGGYVDPALRELVQGPDYPMIVQQTVEGVGQVAVLLPKDTYPELYEKYFETCWLNSAAEGTPWHDPRHFKSLPDPHRDK